MFTHLFRLIWNKKKQNFLLMLEIFLSFIGLFAGATFVLYPYNNYKIPAGFEAENVWSVTFDAPSGINNIDSLKMFRESVRQVVLSTKQVEDVTYTTVNIPYSGNGFNGAVKHGSNQTYANMYITEDNYANILRLKVLEGRWFSRNDDVAKEKPAIINESLKKELFGKGDALGKIIETENSGRTKIIGIVPDTKHESEAEAPPPGLYLRMDTGNMRNHILMLVKVKPGADPALESKIHKTLSNIMRDGNIEIQHLTDMRYERNRMMRVPFIIFIIIATFLIINVALGIFGVLWYNINKRKGEIGLRRAVGASGWAISWQLVAEAVLLATLSLILGSFFAIQFPLMKTFNLPAENYITAFIFSILFIYGLVILCSLYPGKQAAAIYPAEALHED